MAGTSVLYVRIPDEDYHRLGRGASTLGVSRTLLARMALRRFLEDLEAGGVQIGAYRLSVAPTAAEPAAG